MADSNQDYQNSSSEQRLFDVVGQTCEVLQDPLGRIRPAAQAPLHPEMVRQVNSFIFNKRLSIFSRLAIKR